MIRRAHAGSSATSSGRQTNRRRRLGVSPGPVAPYGPPMATLRTCGGPDVSAGSMLLRSSGRRIVATWADVFLRNATATVRAPASTGRRTSSAASAFIEYASAASLAARRAASRAASSAASSGSNASAPGCAPPMVNSRTRSPSRLISSWCGSPNPRMVSMTVRSRRTRKTYSPSRGNWWRTAMPPRVPSGRPSRWSFCVSTVGTR